MSVGKNLIRVDAYDKVTGVAKYTEDLVIAPMLSAKILHSTIANGKVISIDKEAAEKVEGVEKIVTCFDVPDISFPTAGHPFTLDPLRQDVADRKLLNSRVRYYGDDLAVVIATDDLTAEKALRLIKVKYEEYKPIFTQEDALNSESTPLHKDIRPTNVLAKSTVTHGDCDAGFSESCVQIFEGRYETQAVQHCHMELPTSYAYMEAGRIVVVAATQIPHILRRIIGQALGIPWGKIRVIKPYIGGGFGNRQDALYEPLNAFLTTQIGGKAVKLVASREETFYATRTRHNIVYNVKTAVRPDGTLAARYADAYSNQGGYASHGHSILANSIGCYKKSYPYAPICANGTTFYTTLPAGGAMRGYGVPQSTFAAECHMEDMAIDMGFDPLDFRIKNTMRKDYYDEEFKTTLYSDGFVDCLLKGREHFNWDEKREKYKDQKGSVRRGVGVALFPYKSGVHPISMETAGCRLVLNQDGSVQMQVGATEIGQGADTVFVQMAAQASGIAPENIHIISTQDTDISPFDTGAYASRQTYVTGMAIKKAGEEFKNKLIEYAKSIVEFDKADVDLINGSLFYKSNESEILSIYEIAMQAFYNLENQRHITSEVSNHCTTNAFSCGVCYVEVEVDINLCSVKILDILDVHDSGVIINPKLAEGQVHGGVSMGLGFALSEQLLYDEKGKMLNGNFLDYKIPTSKDTPDIRAEFVESFDPTGPFGNKSLGEPPTVPTAAAVRNAVLHATGVRFNTLPITPQKMFNAFENAGFYRDNGANAIYPNVGVYSIRPTVDDKGSNKVDNKGTVK